jgi:hypothetical protein
MCRTGTPNQTQQNTERWGIIIMSMRRQASFRHLASDLHGRRRAVALPKRVRFDSSGVPENSAAEGVGADPTEPTFLVAQGSAFLLFSF